MEKFSLLDIIFNKDDQNDADSSAKSRGFFTREFSGSVTKRFKRILSTGFFRFSKAFSYLLSHISVKVYGTALLSFGLLSTLLYFLRISADERVVTPIVGIAFASFSIPFLLSDKPLPILLQDFRPTDYLFFEFFCMKRHTIFENQKKFPLIGAVAIGFAPALLSTVVPLWQIALAIGVIVGIYIGMESPEFLFLASLASIPFIRLVPNADLILAATLILAVISFLKKVIYGKRVIYFEQYDIFILIMLLFILISGIFVKGVESFSGSVRMIVFALGYFLSGNIITNHRLTERSANSIIVPGAIASLISLGQLIGILIRSGGHIETSELNVLLARADGMAVLLIASAIFAVGMIRRPSLPARAIYVFSAVISIIGLILSGEVFAVIALIIGSFAYLIIKTNKLIGLLLPAFLLIPLAFLLLPNSLLNLIFTYSPSIGTAEELFTLWKNSLEVFFYNIFVGIGIGSESFAEEMAALGTVGYPDSSNLFIELGLEAGVFAFLCFCMILITRLRHRSSRYLYIRNSQIEALSISSGVCLFCLLAFGMVNYIWSDSSAYYLFWCIFGIGSATLRVAKRDYDDQVLYYEETSALDSSVIDIEIG